jgi:hypothetical protein
VNEHAQHGPEGVMRLSEAMRLGASRSRHARRDGHGPLNRHHQGHDKVATKN